MGKKIRNTSDQVRLALVWEDGHVSVHNAAKYAPKSNTPAFWAVTNSHYEFRLKHDRNNNLPLPEYVSAEEGTTANNPEWQILQVIHLKTPELEKYIVPILTRVGKAFADQRTALFQKVCGAFDMQVKVEIDC